MMYKVSITIEEMVGTQVTKCVLAYEAICKGYDFDVKLDRDQDVIKTGTLFTTVRDPWIIQYKTEQRDKENGN